MRRTTPAGHRLRAFSIFVTIITILTVLTVLTIVPGFADPGDIMGNHLLRKLGVGAPMPLGGIMLFDGSRGRAAAQTELQTKWRDWPRFTPGPIRFTLARDPEFPNDTNHVTLQTCCPSAPSWGYDDVQSVIAHGDAKIHVEWNAMGLYDSLGGAGERPDADAHCSENQGGRDTARCYFNSGVYIQSRYEIQLQAFPLGLDIATHGTRHSLGSIVNEYPPLSNQHKLNGQWQSFDVTFRTARYRGNAKLSDAYISVWWNGVPIHVNRRVTGVASGLANHSGEEMNDTLYGLKLQNETGDVRFRNVWIKKLKIDSTDTAFGD